MDVDALVAQQEIPHRFGAGLRNRERHPGHHIVDGDPAVEGPGVGGISAAVVQYRLWERCRAVGRIDVDAKGGVALGQRYSGGGQHAFVSVDVLAVDHQQRSFAREGVRAHAVAGLETGRRSGQATVVGRNGAVGITGLFGSHPRQAGAQPGGFLVRYIGLGIDGQRHEGDSSQKTFHEFHIVILLPGVPGNS
ncbi:hypothetical protein D3C78_1039400 [compost metagenome]